MIQRAVIKSGELAEADFHLMRHERHRAGRLNGGDVGRAKIADAEEPYLARLLEFGERPGHVRRVREPIGAMQQKQINGLNAKPLERTFAGPHDVFTGKIEVIRRTRRVISTAHSGLGHNQDALAHAGNVAQDFAENFFPLALTVDVRVVEYGITGFAGRDDRLLAGGPKFRRAVQPPAAVGQAAGGQ